MAVRREPQSQVANKDAQFRICRPQPVVLELIVRLAVVETFSDDCYQFVTQFSSTRSKEDSTCATWSCFLSLLGKANRRAEICGDLRGLFLTGTRC